jgi:fatty-acid desaturase
MFDQADATIIVSSGEATTRRFERVKWRYAIPIILVHAIAVLAFLPWFFSWTGVFLAVLGCYVFGMLGINIGYHRLLTHRSFSCPPWLERTFAVLGACCLQESPIIWVTFHRRHHHLTDEIGDPHTPVESFFWAHVGWIVFKSEDSQPGPMIGRYAAEFNRDPFYRWLERGDNWVKIALASWAAFFAAGFAADIFAGGTASTALQFALSLLVWGAAVRTVVVWHMTWSVNSVAHIWGYRNYATPDNSRNNRWVALVAAGEGWHNNHHAHPRSARHGHHPGELDLGWLAIRLLMALGLARDVTLPTPDLAATLIDRAERKQAALARDTAE